MFFGVITDRKLVPEPHDIIERFQPEFEKLVCLSLMIPAADPQAPRLAEELLSRAG